MKKQIEVNGKIFKVGDMLNNSCIGDRKILYISENKYFYSDVHSENNDWIPNLKNWTVKKPEREKIELKAYVGAFGKIVYLTKEFKNIVFTPSHNLLSGINYIPRISPISELPSKFIWADTLEYCDSEAGQEG